MCYSLEASITAGLGLGLAGYGMVSKALRYDRRMLLFAAFPLVFSAHQFVEAAVWLTRDDPVAGQPYRYFYTLIAFTMWPVLTPAAAAMRHELEERFRSVLEQLNDEDREILLMRHFEQLTNQEVAQALGLSEPAAGMRHLRALRRLRAALGEPGSQARA